MAETLSHKEESSLTQYLPPLGDFTLFQDEEHYAKKWDEWGMGGKTPKNELWYKGDGYQRIVTIKGYEVHGTHDTLVVEFQDGNLSCIHPAYLKEMQQKSFRRTVVSEDGDGSVAEVHPKQKPAKKKVSLPSEKVHLVAKVKEFSTKYNHFADREDEVVLYEEVIIHGEEELFLGNAWSSKSKSVEKMELQVGDVIEFDAKVVDNKKFNRDVVYKINNPSKIEKK